jgi:hypothetical protein
MHKFVRPVVFMGILLIAAGAVEAQIDARLLRQPDVSATEIAFVYGGDIWVVSKAGGVAHRLSTPKGEESFPRFSPDGPHRIHRQLRRQPGHLRHADSGRSADPPDPPSGSGSDARLVPRWQGHSLRNIDDE